jgi:hypothetical protein
MNSEKMKTNLDAAVRGFTPAISFQVVDQDTLPKTDPRTGYPTPTLLYAEHDVFGMAEPKPPYPEPT